MEIFKKGDLVKRISPDYANVIKGGVYEVESCTHCGSLRLVGDTLSYGAVHFIHYEEEGKVKKVYDIKESDVKAGAVFYAREGSVSRKVLSVKNGEVNYELHQENPEIVTKFTCTVFSFLGQRLNHHDYLLSEPQPKRFGDLSDEEKLEIIKLFMTGVPFERMSATKANPTWNTFRYNGQSIKFTPNYCYRVKDLEPIKQELETINAQIQELLNKADELSKKL